MSENSAYPTWQQLCSTVQSTTDATGCPSICRLVMRKSCHAQCEFICAKIYERSRQAINKFTTYNYRIKPPPAMETLLNLCMEQYLLKFQTVSQNTSICPGYLNFIHGGVVSMSGYYALVRCAIANVYGNFFIALLSSLTDCKCHNK